MSEREEENKNIVTFSQSDVNVRDLESRGRIDPNSSESMDFQPGWTILNYDEYQRHDYQDSEPRRSIRKRNQPLKFRAIGSAEALLVDLSTDEPRNMQESLSGMAKEK